MAAAELDESAGWRQRWRKISGDSRLLRSCRVWLVDSPYLLFMCYCSFVREETGTG